MEEEKEKQQMQDEKLGTAPLGRLIFGLAIPSVVAQLDRKSTRLNSSHTS